MTQSYLDKVADELADLALADQAASGDTGIVESIGGILGASSQTLQEAFLTAVRVRRAEQRAREVLSQRANNNYKAAQPPKAAPLQGVVAEPEPEELEVETPEAPENDAPVSGMPRRVTR